MPTEELGYYVAPEFYAQLIRGKEKVIKGNLDRVYVIDGREGEAGKSTLAMQLAYVCDPTMNLDNVIFKANDFANALRTFDKYKAIIFDESFRGLSSKDALSKQNKKLIQLLQECKQRNFFIFIVLPTIFILELYIAVFRSQALIHAYCSKKSVNRRYYKIFNYSNKKHLYLHGKKLMTYSRPKISKTYRFYNKLPPSINREEYEAKKLAAFREEDEEKPEYSKHLLQRTIFSTELKEKYRLDYISQAKLLERHGCRVDSSVLGKYSRDVLIKRQKASASI